MISVVNMINMVNVVILVHMISMVNVISIIRRVAYVGQWSCLSKCTLLSILSNYSDHQFILNVTDLNHHMNVNLPV